MGRCLDRNTAAGRMALDWPGPPDALGDNLPLRLAGALHGLVRSGQLVELAGLYPPNPLPSEDDLGDAAMAAIAAADGEMCRWLKLPPQTNEVARSAVLYPEQTKDRIASTMAAAGRRASHDAPLAWLAFEQFKDQGTRLTLRLWPGGKLRVLAQADAHGREIRWL